VHVLGRDVPADGLVEPGVWLWSASGGDGLRGRVSRAPGKRPALRRAVRWLLLPEHRRRTFNQWARRARRVAEEIDFDVVHAHDYTALPLGHGLARDRNVPLVYDAHELWSERHRSGRPTPLGDRWQRARERRLGTRSYVVLTVGEALAGRLHAAYGWRHVAVVRNTFPISDGDQGPLFRPSSLVYAGRLAAGRDLETVAMASMTAGVALRLIGPSDASWVATFNPGRCQVGPPVAPNEVNGLLKASGLALVTLSDAWGNHHVALPNKLFQAVAAGVPVVASDVGELARTVREHGLGVLYRPGDPQSLVAAIEEALARFPDLVCAVRLAQDTLSWSCDSATLLQVYQGLDVRR